MEKGQNIMSLQLTCQINSKEDLTSQKIANLTLFKMAELLSSRK